MFLRSPRFGRRPPAEGFAMIARLLPTPCYFRARFLPATVFFGPFRVRAFVRVRCPLTGRPRHLGALRAGDIHAGDASHRCPRPSALTLLVARVGADDAYGSMPTDHLALLPHLL